MRKAITYALIPLEFYTINHTIESISTMNSFKEPSLSGIDKAEKELRRICDMNDMQCYLIVPFGINYPVSAAGYSKYTTEEILAELEDSKWAHNNEVMAQ